MRHTHHRQYSEGAVAACLIALLFMGISFTASAETEIDAYHDGAGVTAFAISSDDVLSINIRVVGPNGYVFEERAEDSNIEWAPESNLPDGVYTWEVWTVTAERGAPMREIAMPRQAAQTVQSVDSIASHQTSDQAGPDLEQIPLERFFAPEFKQVQKASGSFKSEGGVMIDISDEDGAPLSQTYQPNIVERMVASVLDFLVPSAHAQTFTDDILIEKADPSVILDSSASTGQNWQMRGSTNLWAFMDRQNLTTVFGIAPGDGNSNALRITGDGNVGLGTTSATERLHISDTNPRIRLQNTGDAQTWYVKNTNAGQFEIGESTNSGAFVIKPGAPLSSISIAGNGNVGIGTDTPAQPLHVMGNIIRIEDTNSTWDLNPGSQGLWFNRADPTTFGVLKLQNGAPANSIVAAADGVGIGTTSPEDSLHVRRAGGETAAVRIETAGGSISNRRLFFLRNNGNPIFRFEDTSDAEKVWDFRLTANGFAITRVGTGALEMDLRNNGNVTFAGTVEGGSSRKIKHGISKIDSAELLDRLQQLPVKEWRYDAAPGERRIGPMAEDFFELFELGSSSEHIAASDMAGVAMAAAQALSDRSQSLQQRSDQLERENAELRDRLDRIEAKLSY